jgi:4-hydroxybenzoate polyprenyltransferase
LVYNNLRVSATLNYPLILSFSFWHFALFLFDRVYDRHIDKLAQPDEYVPDHQAKFLYGLVAALTLGSLAFYIVGGFDIRYWLMLFPITFLYPLALYRGKRIKSFFLIKNLYSALLIYALPIFLQGFILSRYQIPSDEVLMPIYSLMVYVMIGEIFWDIRDTTVDKENGTHTLPNTLGLFPTKVILVSLILIDAGTRDWNFTGSAIIYLVLLSFVKERTDRLIYHLPPLIALLRFLV